ncbi:hypothetical protein ASPWEDRAFT_172243 [Aspergillus wentii DTO 134E9]|uniref:Uncharacterized protein n=1 Tax=Aspergillus wentii DTO 134E9 TaxID=1073089 RepID=A0A1L9RKI9_ASPWE|nr:uncharacterized protein ASPWEDRAFT_172243 [Aspergillus wentii DTO 134E9]KAI9924796.1 hypothetical protein MW887_006652 [Aspergillus wentii]OJJ35435.1 hypothetical protein ASPWEDRAFT_172243 [Aspergillus wentii DTO 134E9]
MHSNNHNNYSPPTSPFGLSLHTSFPAPRAASDCSTISPFSSTTTSPTSSPTSPFRRLHRSHAQNVPGSCYPDDSRSRSQSPFRLGAASFSLRRSSLLALRRRPSKAEVALSAERSRCDGDAVERQGLDLMEPRPVDPVSIPMDLNANVFPGDRSSMQSQQSRASQPRVIMGGIFEVMEGRA